MAMFLIGLAVGAAAGFVIGALCGGGSENYYSEEDVAQAWKSGFEAGEGARDAEE